MEGYGTMGHGPGRSRKQGGPWTNTENGRLVTIVERYANKSQLHWVEIAKEHGTRDAKQCRERWDNHLKPGVNRAKISPDEGREIMDWVRDHGKHWAPLGRLLRRPENMVKNYFYQESKKAERGGAKHRRNASRQLSSSVPMSRDNSGSSSHHRYGPAAVSSLHTLHTDYNNHGTASPYETQALYYQSHQYSSRRTSVASNVTNPPALTPDHGSPAESPRFGAEVPIPYPQGQLALPACYPLPIEIPLRSPYDLVTEGAGHKRVNSSSSYGSAKANAANTLYSPFSSPINLPSAVGHSNNMAFPAPFTTRGGPQTNNYEAPPSNSRKSSDARMSLAHILR